VYASWLGRGCQYPTDVLDIGNNASRGNSKCEEHQQESNPSALVFQLVTLARFHGFGRIYRRIPDLLVDDRP
jgi:hypothetical protein